MKMPKRENVRAYKHVNVKKFQRADVSGITLIELIVVIAIIGLLASVVTPLAGTTIRRAKITNTKSRLDSLNEALRLYYDCKFDLPDSLDDLEPDYIRASKYADDYKYDAWRKEIVYTKSDSVTATLVSYGPNRSSGGGDDITCNVICMDIYRQHKNITQNELAHINKVSESFVRDGNSLSSSVTSADAGFSAYLTDSGLQYDPWGIRPAPGEPRANGAAYHFNDTKKTFYSYGPDGADDSCAGDDILPEGVP